MREIKKTLGNVTLDVHGDGEYNIDGKKIPYSVGIKIKVGKSKLDISARDLLALKSLMSDKEIREELQKRYSDEEAILKDMTF